MKTLALTAGMLLGTFAFAADANAYMCLEDSCPRWCDAARVTYSLGQLPAGTTEDEVVAALADAAASWNALDCLPFDLEYEGRTPASGATADIDFYWQNPWDINLGGPATYSVGLPVYTVEGCMVPGAVAHNDADFAWNASGTHAGTDRDIRSVAIVDFGRMLGLGNSSEPDAVVTSDVMNVITGPGADDIEGICAIYAARGGDMGPASEDMGTADIGDGQDAGSEPGPDAGTDSGGADMGGDLGSTPGQDTGGGSPDAGDDGGCCATVRPSSGAPLGLLSLVLGLIGLRRRGR